MFRPLPTLFLTGLMILQMKKGNKTGQCSQEQKKCSAFVKGTLKGLLLGPRVTSFVRYLIILCKDKSL